MAGNLAQLARAGALGVPSAAAGADTDRFRACQTQRRARRSPRYDYIVLGVGAAGSSNRAARVAPLGLGSTGRCGRGNPRGI